jgi:uncharacterized protein involved in response to NO
MPSAAARRAFTGPALFSFGFRPFFLGAGIWSALALPLWLWAYMGGGPATFDRDWHVHEMLFGYLAAVAAGFLLTAVPNWTGRMPVIGAPLAGLFALWLAGRVAMLLIGHAPVAAASVDAAFLIAFAAVIWREVATGRNWRNLPVCLMVSVLAAANVAFHARWAALDAGPIAERAALAAMAGLIALIGGRITPSFTRNWLMQRKAAREPAPFGLIDRLGLGACVAGLVLWILVPLAAASGAALALAGAGLLARLARWRTADTLSEPLVWSLHLGYGWLGLALLLIGGSVLAPDVVPRTAGIHALTAGAAGVMTLAVMTRATLGHTGRARQADRATLVLYLLINAAAVVRVAAPFLGELQFAALAAAGALWSAAFAVFVAAYGPMLASPRAPAADA